MTTIGPISDKTHEEFNLKKKRKPDGKLETSEELLKRLLKSESQNNSRVFAHG